MRLYPDTITSISCSGWWPITLLSEHDNVFLSFLQKLSLLRERNRIRVAPDLARITNKRYDKCPYVQRAYKIMMTTGSPWSHSLEPWFNYIETTKMDSNRAHEYAHWFGHILSLYPYESKL